MLDSESGKWQGMRLSSFEQCKRRPPDGNWREKDVEKGSSRKEKKKRRERGRGREASHKTSEESPAHGHFRSVVGEREREREKEVERDSEREGDVRIQEKKKVNLFFLRREQKKMDDRSRPTTITSSQSRFPTVIGCFAGGMTSARRRWRRRSRSIAGWWKRQPGISHQQPVDENSSVWRMRSFVCESERETRPACCPSGWPTGDRGGKDGSRCAAPPSPSQRFRFPSSSSSEAIIPSADGVEIFRHLRTYAHVRRHPLPFGGIHTS